MFGSKHYNGIIRKYVVLMGTLFNNIEIDRINSSNVVIQSLRVPISYGPKERFLARIEAVGQDLDRKIGFKLPAMSFEMTSFQYASERRLNPNKQMLSVTDRDSKSYKSVYTPTPFDIGFQVSIFVKNAEDGVRILEQILPYFTPEFTATIKPLDDIPNLRTDIPIVFNGLNTEDTYEGDYETRRVLIHTLDFTLKGYVYGPVSYKSGIIKTANSALFIDTNGPDVFDLTNDTFASELYVAPGLDSNGTATSNSSISVAVDSISANQDFGYIVTKTDG
jgi:hypothetical protein